MKNENVNELSFGRGSDFRLWSLADSRKYRLVKAIYDKLSLEELEDICLKKGVMKNEML